MALFTSDWTPTANGCFFRRNELYNMSWSESVWTANTLVCAAREGGPILVCRDSTTNAAPIATYSASGVFYGITKSRGMIAAAGWTRDERAVIVESAGQVCLYQLFLDDFETVAMSQEVRKYSVLEAKIFESCQGTGVATLCGNNRFYIMNNILQQKTSKLPDMFGGAGGLGCWTVAVVRAKSCVFAAKELDLSMSEMDGKAQSVRCVSGSGGGWLQQVAGAAPRHFVSVCLDATGSRLAALTDSGHVVLCQLDDAPAAVRVVATATRHVTNNVQLQWCGSVAVCFCSSSSSLSSSSAVNQSLSVSTGASAPLSLQLIVADCGDTVTFPLDTPCATACHLCAETDSCVRIVTPLSHEIVEMVTESSVAVLSIGSMDPAAVLLEAYREYEKSSHKADEYLRMVGDRLAESVSVCVEAASAQNSVPTQQLLLRAALYGRCFLDNTDPHLYMSTCRYMRVLNSLRHPDCGIPLTYQQLRGIPVSELVTRLCRRRLFFLALRVCRLLQLTLDTGAIWVLQRWAEHTVTAAASAAASQLSAVRHISATLAAPSLAWLRLAAGANCGVSLADVARVAQSCGKTDAAKALLELEPVASRKVPLLVELGEADSALQQAAASCDPHLIYTALLQLQQLQLQPVTPGVPRTSFQMLLHNYPVAQAMFAKYLRARGDSGDRLLDLLVQEDNFCGQAQQQLQEAAQLQRHDLRTPLLSAASELFRKGRNEFLATETANQVKLIKCQLSLEQTCGDQFAGLSLVATIARLIVSGKHRLADGLRNDFKLSDKRWWHLKVTAYATNSLWLEMEKFAKSKKSPIGYEPFVDACLDHDQMTEARKYIARVKDELKVTYLCRVGDLEKAARLAFERRDSVDLSFVEDRCGSSQPELVQKIQQLKLAMRR